MFLEKGFVGTFVDSMPSEQGKPNSTDIICTVSCAILDGLEKNADIPQYKKCTKMQRKEIAERLGYANHSSVSRLLKRIAGKAKRIIEE